MPAASSSSPAWRPGRLFWRASAVPTSATFGGRPSASSPASPNSRSGASAVMPNGPAVRKPASIHPDFATDGSISDIPRADYVAAEERVAQELRALGKPFVIVLNCVEPHSEANETLAASLREKYDAPVLPLNCLALTQQEPERRFLERQVQALN